LLLACALNSDLELKFSFALPDVHNSVAWLLLHYRAAASGLRRLFLRLSYMPIYGGLYVRYGFFKVRYFLKVRLFYIRYYLSRHGIGHF
jgi:hypothetical protein